MKISREDIEKGLDEAYKKAGVHAYFGNGFHAGVKFAISMIPKSVLLQIEASKEDNDIKSFNLHNKSAREARKEAFDNLAPSLVEMGYVLTTNDSAGRVTIDLTSFGVIDYYPKANKILIRKENEWKKNGLQWIKENIL